MTTIAEMREELEKQNVRSIKPLITPEEVHKEFPLSNNAVRTTFEARKSIADIVKGSDPRKIIMLGPCSVHDVDAAIEYAGFIADLQEGVKNEYLLVMRAPNEKPRTTTGWEGLVRDPRIDQSYDIDEGLRLSRKLYTGIANAGVPVGLELMGGASFQYYGDAISTVWVGARSTEDQNARDVVSGVPVPAGFKNNTQGDIDCN